MSNFGSVLLREFFRDAARETEVCPAYKAHASINPNIETISPTCKERLLVARKLPGATNWITRFTMINIKPIMGSSPLRRARYSDMRSKNFDIIPLPHRLRFRLTFRVPDFRSMVQIEPAACPVFFLV